MSVFNKREKLSAPPFVTVNVEDTVSRRKIFKKFSTLSNCRLDEKSSTFSSEGILLKSFTVRKGVQLRLEKAMMLTHRILTLVLRWKNNACWDDFCKFKDAFESDDAKLKPTKRSEKGQQKKTDRVMGSVQEIRLPSRQWANWVIYLTLRDIMLLAKIKNECERTVGYWLGMISCSHHPGDSLIIVGILSRLWAVSSGMVEDYANQIYPCMRFISSLLSPTKADNWLVDIDFPDDLFTWLEDTLCFPFKPAQIGGYEQTFKTSDRQDGSSSSTNVVLTRDFKYLENEKKTTGEDVPSTSSLTRDLDKNDDEEDVGIPVNVEQSKKVGPKAGKRKGKKAEKTGKKVVLDERWTKFFKNFKPKLCSEVGRKQLLTRIKKYRGTESNPVVNVKLVKLRKFVKQNDQDKLLIFIPKLKRFLSKSLANKPS